MPIARISSEILVNTTTLNDQLRPEIAALADGRFVITWQSADPDDGSSTCIRARVFNPDGTGAAADFRVNSTTSGGQEAPAVTGLQDGHFVITWQSDDPGDGSLNCIRSRIYSSSGNPVGTDTVLNTSTLNQQFGPPMVTTLADGRYVVTWTSFDTGDGSGLCVRGRIFGADGSITGDDFILNTATEDGQAAPSVTALADGRFVVTWDSNDPDDDPGRCIRGRIFDADGTAAENDFHINTTILGDQELPSVTALMDGRIVVVWASEDTGDGSFECVRGRIYDAAGTPVGSNDFIVNTTTENRQDNPSVTGLADGRFVVAWDSFEEGDGELSCIRARLYNIDGTAAGSDFIVNTTGGGIQFRPAVTALADGRFVVAWDSDDALMADDGPGSDGSHAGIRAQIFDPTTFTGTGAGDTWKGGNFADSIYGLGGSDVISGLGGDDLMNGDLGNDMLHGGDGNDRLFGGSESDILNGNAGADILRGGIGHDTLDGGTDNDIMTGDSGNDRYFVDTAADIVNEAVGQGIDEVRASASYTLASGAEIETFRTTNDFGTSSINLTGNGFFDTITGNDGDNILNGGDGSDTLTGRSGHDTIDGNGGIDTTHGGMGDDRHFVDDNSDRVNELVGQGNDTVIVKTAITYALQGGSEFELMRTMGSASTYDINLTGNELAQSLHGNAAGNTLDGRGDADTMHGFGGNDIYFVDNAGDQVFETAGNGDDRVIVSESIIYTLQAGSDVELLRTMGSASTYAVDLHGNELANTIQGNSGTNKLSGGLGNDTLTGFAGNDIFRFNTALGASNVDQITDFNVVADTIQLENAVFTALAAGALAGGAFNTGAAATQADDRIIYNSTNGALSYDSDGNEPGGNAAIQFATLAPGLGLTSADFFVI